MKINRNWKLILAKLLVAVSITGMGMATPLTTRAEDQEPMKAYYSAYLYQRGWTGEYQDNRICAAPAGSYVTAVAASLRNQPEGMTGTLSYQVNLSGSGWMEWTENGAACGGTETDMPLEAVRFRLTGQLSENYDIYYAVLQNGVWTSWISNEATAGTEGAGLRIDGIKLSVVAKGAGEPGPVSGIDPARPMVALTFDDGPSAPVTNRILNSLEANGGRATFFMVGSRVPGNAASVQRMVALGSEVANHTNDHKYLPNLGDSGIRSQVGTTSQKIQEASGVGPVMVRPPGGYYNTASLNTLGSMGMPAIMWSIDTKDWKTRNAQSTIRSVLDHVQDGDIVLMHDIYSTTADAAEVIIPELVARGYQLVTVSELAAYRGGMAAGHVYSQFRP